MEEQTLMMPDNSKNVNHRRFLGVTFQRYAYLLGIAIPFGICPPILGIVETNAARQSLGLFRMLYFSPTLAIVDGILIVMADIIGVKWNVYGIAFLLNGISLLGGPTALIWLVVSHVVSRGIDSNYNFEPYVTRFFILSLVGILIYVLFCAAFGVSLFFAYLDKKQEKRAELSDINALTHTSESGSKSEAAETTSSSPV